MPAPIKAFILTIASFYNFYILNKVRMLCYISFFSLFFFVIFLTCKYTSATLTFVYSVGDHRTKFQHAWYLYTYTQQLTISLHVFNFLRNSECRTNTLYIAMGCNRPWPYANTNMIYLFFSSGGLTVILCACKRLTHHTSMRS